MSTHNDNVIDLMNKVAELEQELAEFKQWQKEDHDKLVKQVRTIDALEQELKMARDNDRCSFAYLSEIREALHFDGDFPSLVDYCKQLSRYAGAVEVEGIIEKGWIHQDEILPSKYDNQRVKVLVFAYESAQGAKALPMEVE